MHIVCQVAGGWSGVKFGSEGETAGKYDGKEIPASKELVSGEESKESVLEALLIPC